MGRPAALLLLLPLLPAPAQDCTGHGDCIAGDFCSASNGTNATLACVGCAETLCAVPSDPSAGCAESCTAVDGDCWCAPTLLPGIATSLQAVEH